MVDGFATANIQWVRQLPGGVVRRDLPSIPTVAVVIGGGSGHYPAFVGLVGPGLAHGAVVGDVFASPSAEKIHSVASRVHTGAGVLLTYGNYAGDVLNFDQAQERLIADGIACRTVVVTDDICSASPDQMHRRRGIAGDLAVFKVAGTAADQGRSLEEVERLATRANQNCRSMGVAFSGCTLPGADRPLFDVPVGRMAVGMGVHGEPGLTEEAMPTADALARLLVKRLLAERPHSVADDAPVVVLLNGLGSVKYEELFVVFRQVARELADAGINVVDARVGELVTSFDMAGASLTLFWLDEELTELWSAPAESPAFSRLGTASKGVGRSDKTIAGLSTDLAIPNSTPESRVGSAAILAALKAASEAIDSATAELGRIDAVAGDGDHGIGMQRGVGAAAEAAETAYASGAGAQTTLIRAADAWANCGGGASGALWGVGLRALAAHLSDEAKPTTLDLSSGIKAASRAVQSAGKAQVGDKTIVDALEPFSITFAQAARDGSSTYDAWARAAKAALAAADGTASMVAKVGRARPHADKSLGTPDPGAVSFAIVVRSALIALPANRLAEPFAGDVSNG